MPGSTFVRIDGRYYPISQISCISPLDSGDVLISFREEVSVEGRTLREIRVTGGEAQAVQGWVRSASVDPMNGEWGLPERGFT